MQKRFFITICFAFFLAVSFGALPVLADSISLPFPHESVEFLPDVGLRDPLPPSEEGGIGGTIGEGIEGFDQILVVVGNALMFVLGGIALLALFVSGYNLVTAQSKASETWEEEKRNVLYVVMGLLIFALTAEFVYKFLYIDDGGYLLEQSHTIDPLTGRATGPAIDVAISVVERIESLITLFLNFAGVGAILILVIAAMRLVINPGSDEVIEKQKKLVGFVALGIIIINLARTIVSEIIFPDAGYSGPSLEAFEAQLTGLSNFILSFLGVILLVSFILSGVAMLVYYGNEDIITRVKTTLKNVVIGTLVAYSAYTIVATLLAEFVKVSATS